MENEKIQPEQDQPEQNIQIGTMEKDGEKMLESIEKENMVAILSKNEIMYVFELHQAYQCFIHPIDAPEGRRKTLEKTEKDRAILKQLATMCDQLFEIEHDRDLDLMGVMVAAEQAIVRLLDQMGCLPADDYDFMEAMDGEHGKHETGNSQF